MMALILERDECSRTSLVSLLSRLGYSPILVANQLSKLEYLMARHKSQIKLIVVSDAGPGETFSRSPEMVAHLSDMFLTPLIQIAGRWGFAFSRRPSPSSRIDETVTRPFGLQSLKSAIERAHVQRASRRDVLVLFSPRAVSPVLRDSIPSHHQHWREMTAVTSVAELEQTIQTRGGQIGAVVVDPEIGDAGVATWAAQFKRSPLGIVTPLAVLSRDAEKVRNYRLTADLFSFRPNGEGGSDRGAWGEILRTLSQRVLHSWSAREIITHARRAIKAGQYGQIANAVKLGLDLDPRRAEFRELAGLLAEKRGERDKAIGHYKMALQDNPCSPLPYLKLMRLLNEGDEKRRIVKMGAGFCPAHPQVQSAIQSSKHPRSGHEARQ